MTRHPGLNYKCTHPIWCLSRALQRKFQRCTSNNLIKSHLKQTSFFLQFFLQIQLDTCWMFNRSFFFLILHCVLVLNFWYFLCRPSRKFCGWKKCINSKVWNRWLRKGNNQSINDLDDRQRKFNRHWINLTNEERETHTHKQNKQASAEIPCCKQTNCYSSSFLFLWPKSVVINLHMVCQV